MNSRLLVTLQIVHIVERESAFQLFLLDRFTNIGEYFWKKPNVSRNLQRFQFECSECMNKLPLASASGAKSKHRGFSRIEKTILVQPALAKAHWKKTIS
jgi:hypothetical protein